MTPPLPPVRSLPYRVALVCLGNICRSPMAETVLADRVTAAGLDDRVALASGGTGGWHVGGPMDERAARTLADAGYDGSAHRAQQTDRGWLDRHDLLLAMDTANLADLEALGPRPGSLVLFRDFDPEAAEADRDVPDPYYGGEDGFGEVLAMVERTADALVTALIEHLTTAPAGPPS